MAQAPRPSPMILLGKQRKSTSSGQPQGINKHVHRLPAKALSNVQLSTGMLDTSTRTIASGLAKEVARETIKSLNGQSVTPKSAHRPVPLASVSQRAQFIDAKTAAVFRDMQRRAITQFQKVLRIELNGLANHWKQLKSAEHWSSLLTKKHYADITKNMIAGNVINLFNLGYPESATTSTGNTERDLDQTLINNLLRVSRKRLPGVDTIQSRFTQDSLIKVDPNNLVPIILADFALGRGRDTWEFDSTSPVTKRLLEGYVIHDLEITFYNNLRYSEPNVITYKDFLKRKSPVRANVRFSPDQLYLLGSLNRHIVSNKIQFMTAGCVASIMPGHVNGWADVVLTNSTSRESLILHLFDSYDRSNGLKPLSTIRQEYRFRIRLDPNRFPKSNEDRSILGSGSSYGLY